MVTEIKLLPCPFCGGKASIGKTIDGMNWQIVCRGECRCTSAYFAQKENAVAAWNRRPAPENKPLTLEQLRQMDGEPVWIDGKDYGGWTIFKDSANKQVARCLDNVNLSYYMDDYGKTWLAYARKPEQEEK